MITGFAQGISCLANQLDCMRLTTWIGYQLKLDRERPDCDCSKTVKELQDKLADPNTTIDDLTKQIATAVPLPPFCKESFISDDFTLTQSHWFAKFDSCL